MVGMEGSLKIAEPWDGWVGRVLKGHGVMEWDALEGSLEIIEPWDGWVGTVPKGHGAMRWLGWKGPGRS